MDGDRLIRDERVRRFPVFKRDRTCGGQGWREQRPAAEAAVEEATEGNSRPQGWSWRERESSERIELALRWIKNDR